MAFETLGLILSTALSITFMQCCKIVLMFYNAMGMDSVFYGFETLKIIL